MTRIVTSQDSAGGPQSVHVGLSEALNVAAPALTAVAVARTPLEDTFDESTTTTLALLEATADHAYPEVFDRPTVILVPAFTVIVCPLLLAPSVTTDPVLAVGEGVTDADGVVGIPVTPGEADIAGDGPTVSSVGGDGVGVGWVEVTR
jgi:hypothetical protein